MLLEQQSTPNSIRTSSHLEAQVVLSHYPASSEDLNDKEVPRICNSTWLDEVGVCRSNSWQIRTCVTESSIGVHTVGVAFGSEDLSFVLGQVGVWRLWEAENQLPPGQFVPVCVCGTRLV